MSCGLCRQQTNWLSTVRPANSSLPNTSGIDRTPRAFIAFSDDADGVPSINGLYYYLALKENNILASLYIYPSGGHGRGYNKDFKYHKEMIQDLRAWLLSF